MKSKVFFSSEITAEKVVELFHAAANDLPGGILPGKVAVKLHSGEPGNQNFLKPEFWQPVVNVVHGTVVECNTAYDGGRNTTEKHRETMEKHGWSKHFTVDIMVFINVMKNMSVDCDCCSVAEDPCMADIGILASLDPIAVDRACLDLVYASDDPGRDHLLERIESRNGAHTIDAAAELGFGSKEYELIKL